MQISPQMSFLGGGGGDVHSAFVRVAKLLHSFSLMCNFQKEPIRLPFCSQNDKMFERQLNYSGFLFPPTFPQVCLPGNFALFVSVSWCSKTLKSTDKIIGLNWRLGLTLRSIKAWLYINGKNWRKMVKFIPLRYKFYASISSLQFFSEFTLKIKLVFLLLFFFFH